MRWRKYVLEPFFGVSLSGKSGVCLLHGHESEKAGNMKNEVISCDKKQPIV